MYFLLQIARVQRHPSAVCVKEGGGEGEGWLLFTWGGCGTGWGLLRRTLFQPPFPTVAPPNVLSLSLLPPSIHPSRCSFVLQGFGLDVVGDPHGSGQRQDGVVDGSHFHSQGDGVLVLAVHCAVILTHGRDRRSQSVLKDARFYTPKRPATPASATLLRVLYLCRGGGLQSVKAKRSAERSLVKVGQIACLEARGTMNKAAQTHSNVKNRLSSNQLVWLLGPIHRRGAVKQDNRTIKLCNPPCHLWPRLEP